MNRLARTDASPQHTIHFCTHCGALSNEGERRVCVRCGMGVVLACAPGLLPKPGAAFLVVKADLRISAASEAAEPLLGSDLVGQPLLDVLSGDPGLPRWIMRASMGSTRVVSVALRRGTRRINGRIAACGDPPAALLVLV
jgi:ribosomal protein S27AE